MEITKEQAILYVTPFLTEKELQNFIEALNEQNENDTVEIHENFYKEFPAREVLWSAFSWSQTKEEFDYWKAIVNRINMEETAE